MTDDRDVGKHDPAVDEPRGVPLSDATSIPEFPIALWREVERAPRRLLLLDYDGTLAAFRTDRAAATPEPRALAALERLSRAGHTRIAIV